jgi:hypothetical protein
MYPKKLDDDSDVCDVDYVTYVLDVFDESDILMMPKMSRILLVSVHSSTIFPPSHTVAKAKVFTIYGWK